MQISARWAALAIAGVAVVTLAGCSGSSSSGSGNSTAGAPNIPVSTVPPTPPPGDTPGKLTGHFCNDIKHTANDMQVPPDATGNAQNLKTNGIKYLATVQKQFISLASEAPKPVAKDLLTIADEYKSIAKAISSENLDSLQKVEKQMEGLTSKGAVGTAFRSLISYMITKCP